MQRLEVSGAVRLLYGSLGVKALRKKPLPTRLYRRCTGSGQKATERAPENITWFDSNKRGCNLWHLLPHLPCYLQPPRYSLRRSLSLRVGYVKNDINLIWLDGLSTKIKSNMSHTVCPFRKKGWLTFWRRNFSFWILTHPVYKMWIIREPNKLELWNKLHSEEEKTDSIYHV